MADTGVHELLSQLTGITLPERTSDAPPPNETAKQPASDTNATQAERQRQHDEKLNALLGRIAKISGQSPEQIAISTNSTNTKPVVGSTGGSTADDDFYPIEPTSFRDAKISDSDVEALILKFLLARGDATGREIADQVKLSFVPIEELLRQMKQDQLVFHRGSAAMNDYQFQLTDLGRERGRRHTEHCTYFGAAPVSLSDYIDSVAAQSITRQRPTPANLQHAFDDLLISSKMMNRIGPAINSGRGMFLFGARGNGKNEHCGAHHSCFWAVYLDSASDRRRRRNHSSLRPQQSRASALGRLRHVNRSAKN